MSTKSTKRSISRLWWLYNIPSPSQRLKKVIWLKDLYIFKDYKTKVLTKLFDYNKGKLTLQSFLSKDNNKKESKTLTSICTNS